MGVNLDDFFSSREFQKVAGGKFYWLKALGVEWLKVLTGLGTWFLFLFLGSDSGSGNSVILARIFKIRELLKRVSVFVAGGFQ